VTNEEILGQVVALPIAVDGLVSAETVIQTSVLDVAVNVITRHIAGVAAEHPAGRVGEALPDRLAATSLVGASFDL
jgi:hypothetical protein